MIVDMAILTYVVIFAMTFASRATFNALSPSLAYAIFWPFVFFFYLLKYAVRGSMKYVKDFWK